MDLSKTFDFLPHDLLLLKLNAYGLSKSFSDLLYSYLTNRKQCVKLNQNLFNMLPIFKGSILGLILFNIFINDLFFSVKKNCSMYNYADKSLEKVISALEEDSNSLINWFSANKMQANNEKFQAISVGRKTHDNNVMFNLNSINISGEDEVKLLGVTIDFKLNFDTSISNICKKAARQLNVLKRIGKHLNRLGKLTIYH